MKTDTHQQSSVDETFECSSKNSQGGEYKPSLHSRAVLPSQFSVCFCSLTVF